MSVRKMTEITVAVRSEMGELARVLGLASQSGSNVVAFCGYEHGEKDPGATIMIVPDKPDKALGALTKAGYTCRANEVVAVTGATGKGMGARLAEKFALSGINILYSYASCSGSGHSTAIFRVVKPDSALKILKS